MNPDHIHIKVTIDDPRAPVGSAPQQVWITVERGAFRDAFAPLPRNREIPFEFEAQRRAVEQKEARRHAAEVIARSLAPAIIEAMEKIDDGRQFRWRNADFIKVKTG